MKIPVNVRCTLIKILFLAMCLSKQIRFLFIYLFIYFCSWQNKSQAISKTTTRTTTIGTTVSVQNKVYATHAMELKTPYKANAAKNI